MDQQPPAPQPIPPIVAAEPSNPGQTTGVIGLVLSFVGLGLIGIVLSIISVTTSSKAKQSTALGVVGIILNSLSIIIVGIIGTIFIIASFGYSGVNSRAHDSASTASAMTVEKKAEAFFALDNTYPSSVADFSKYEESSLTSGDIIVIDGAPSDDSTIGYKSCGTSGAVVFYYKTTAKSVIPLYLGDGSPATC